jgi:hypothetical protein
MASFPANGAQRLSRAAGQHGTQGWQDLRDGHGRQQPPAHPAQQSFGLEEHQWHLKVSSNHPARPFAKNRKTKIQKKKAIRRRRKMKGNE